MPKKLCIVRVSPEAHRKLRLYSALKQVHYSRIVTDLINDGLPSEEQMIALTKVALADKGR